MIDYLRLVAVARVPKGRKPSDAAFEKLTYLLDEPYAVMCAAAVDQESQSQLFVGVLPRRATGKVALSAPRAPGLFAPTKDESRVMSHPARASRG